MTRLLDATASTDSAEGVAGAGRRSLLRGADLRSRAERELARDLVNRPGAGADVQPMPAGTLGTAPVRGERRRWGLCSGRSVSRESERKPD